MIFIKNYNNLWIMSFRLVFIVIAALLTMDIFSSIELYSIVNWIKILAILFLIYLYFFVSKQEIILKGGVFTIDELYKNIFWAIFNMDPKWIFKWTKWKFKWIISKKR